MAEIGAIASIVGLAAVGVQLSQTLYNIGSKIKDVKSNLNRIATHIVLFSSSLKHVGAVLDDNRSLHSPEAVGTAMQIVNECQSVFEEIGRMAQMAVSGKGGDAEQEKALGTIGANDKKRRMSVLQRVRWHFEQPKVDCLLAQLEHLKTTLSLMIQTLNLAAVTLKNKQTQSASEQNIEQINQERMHVETLIVARHLSLIVLGQAEKEAGMNGSDSPGSGSLAESENPDGTYGPKLLTEGASASLSLVRHGMGELEFLDRAMTTPNEAISPLMHTSHTYVDELLCHWTRLSEKEVGLGIQTQHVDVDLEEQPMNGIVETPKTERENPIQPQKDLVPPDLRLQHVEFPLDVYELPAVAARTSSLHPVYPSNAHALSLDRLYPIPLANTKITLSRSISTPNSEHPPKFQTFPYVPTSKAGIRHSATRGPSYSYPYIAPPPISTSASQTIHYLPNQVSRSISSFSPGSSRNSQPALEFYPPCPKDPAHQPYVSSPTNSSPSSSRSASPLFDDERQTSASGLGLGIPWRIRVSPTKYFDFLDAELVGPRTPYLPTEPISWVYSREHAVTEVASGWVCEEAVRERRLMYSERSSEDREWKGNYTWKKDARRDEEKFWKIHHRLKFSEIESLVERTIAIYRQKTTSTSTFVSMPQSRTPQPYLRPTHLQPPPPSQQQNRSVSFSNLPPQQKPSRSLRPDERSPRTSAEVPPSEQRYWAGGPNANQNSSSPRSGASWRDGSDSRYDNDGDRDRERNRDRLVSRGKSSGGGGRKNGDGEKKKKEKKSGMSTTVTLARLGALAALLEGVDLAF